MKLFLIGMPQTGRTTVAKALCQADNFRYIDAFSWVKTSFRERKEGEKIQLYEDEFHNWFTNRLKINPQLVVENVKESVSAYPSDDKLVYVIDGIRSPRDFQQLFDYNKDIVVFLNRVDKNDADYKDYENIGVCVMKDFCFWLSSADLLPRERWFEYNFAFAGDDSDKVKSLGQKNSVFIVRSLNRVISHLKDQLK